ncbi:MAG TPA: hypothetical protein GXX69_07060 [Firmicutes bacterium]|nr:hypothetical protein [Bacillota bacterium]
MAVAIRLASLNNPGALRKRITEGLMYLQRQGLQVSLHEIERGQLTFLGCNIKRTSVAMPPEQAQGLLRCFLANVLADVIITHCEENLVRKLVKQEYSNLSFEERQKIVDLVLQSSNRGLLPALPERHSRIVSELTDYLSCFNTIILEGFVRFRLRDYQQELKEAIERVADDVEDEREYWEFIQLLRYFVHLQDSQWPKIQVLPEENGRFKLLDEKSQPLSLGDFGDGFGSHENLTQSDLLISALVCMSPATIVLHLGSASTIWTQDVLTTIQDVFPGQVTTCLGCWLCLKQP